jgi:spermidine synthase
MTVEIIQMKGYHFLWIDNYLWMWDIPIEQEIQKSIAEQASGDVLIAGYGLGIVQKYLLENNKVKSVITVELLSEVIQANQNVFGKVHGKIIEGDFFNLPSSEKYDCVIGDIWEDILPEGLETYKKFRERALQLLKPNGKLLAWGADYFEYLIEKERLVLA